MKHNLKAPCRNCPFRKEGAIELRPGRVAGIVRDLQNDFNTFPCHKTTHGSAKIESACMGAVAYSFRQSRTSILTRLALRAGDITPEQIEANYPLLIAPVHAGETE